MFILPPGITKATIFVLSLVGKRKRGIDLGRIFVLSLVGIRKRGIDLGSY